MDPISLAFYAVVCGVLGLAAPAMGGMAVRLSVGAAVGLGAAALLPLLRDMMTYGP